MNIKIGQIKEIASCNSCGGHNYDCCITGEKKNVDIMHFVKVGNIHINICDNCLHKLSILANRQLIETTKGGVQE